MLSIRFVKIASDVSDKLQWKHRVAEDEVRQVFRNIPHIRFYEKGQTHQGKHVYAAYGRTDAGRYLTVFFIHKLNQDALVITARDMARHERKKYGKTKEGSSS